MSLSNISAFRISSVKNCCSSLESTYKDLILHFVTDWSEYSDYGLCPVTCHGGIQRATRTCVGGTVGQLGCIGSEERTRVNY